MESKNDTIIALSTPLGVGAIGLIRLSGSNSYSIVNQFLTRKITKENAHHKIFYGLFIVNKKIIDEVVVSAYKAPFSYTKEDVVEISCHGSSFIIEKIIENCIAVGARYAKPGEFTLRAFLNGRFDLSQAEAVADLIISDSEASHEIALQQMRGGFSTEIQDLRKDLIHFASLIELELDFGEEDVEFADREDLKAILDKANRKIENLLESFKYGNAIKEGVSTVIAGRPNAGKSTLLNILLNEDRAIVSEIAGTTRDVIEEKINIGGVVFRLIDTAGIREATDIIEQLGVQKTLDKIQKASILVYVFDASETATNDVIDDVFKLQRDGLEIVLIANKSDLCDERKLEEQLIELKANFIKEDQVISISAKQNIKIEEIKTVLKNIFNKGIENKGNTIVTNIRHIEALNNANKALNNANECLNNNLTNDFLALEIRHALHAIGEISGDISNEDLLDNIFRNFCIGK